MTFFHLRTEMVVPASTAVTWAALTDFKAYPEWNPLVLEARGTAERGAWLRLRVADPAGSSRVFRILARITRCEAERELAWVGSVPVLFRGEHYFSLAPENGATRLEHGERMGGLIPRLQGRPYLERYRTAYEGLNVALVQRVRAREAAASA